MTCTRRILFRASRVAALKHTKQNLSSRQIKNIDLRNILFVAFIERKALNYEKLRLQSKDTNYNQPRRIIINYDKCHAYKRPLNELSRFISRIPVPASPKRQEIQSLRFHCDVCFVLQLIAPIEKYQRKPIDIHIQRTRLQSTARSAGSNLST